MSRIRNINRYHFSVEWGGEASEIFEVNGLNLSVCVELVRNSDSKLNNEIKMPGLTKYSDVTLTRYITQGNNEFFEWINTNQFGEVERRDIKISLLNHEFVPILFWMLYNAFPSQYIGPVLIANNCQLATESLVISYDTMRMEMNGGFKL